MHLYAVDRGLVECLVDDYSAGAVCALILGYRTVMDKFNKSDFVCRFHYPSVEFHI